MRTLLLFELKSIFTKLGFYILLLLIVLLGIFSGSNARMSIGPNVYMNAPYVVAYLLGFMSLLSIFFTTMFATQILFKETDNNFNLILYATPIRKQDYLLSRFIAVFTLSFLCFTMFVTGFALGQGTLLGKEGYTSFKISYFVQPLLVFGFVNTLFCTAILSCVAWVTKNKLMVYVAGLFIYILYMVMLIFSGSPIMAKGMPQSETAVLLSASLDPFGISAYFLQTSKWSVLQRNTASIPLSGILLFNRIGVLLFSLLLLLASLKFFHFSVNKKRNHKREHKKIESTDNCSYKMLSFIQPSIKWQRHLAAVVSYIKIDLKYIRKSIPFILTCIGLLFYLSMEIYGAIEKGVRLPQKYASSGLMANAIIENFHGLCLIVILYYTNDIVWRSRNSNFQLIEDTTPASNTVLFFSKWITVSTIIIFFSTLMILLGIVFQLQYNYPVFDWTAYAGVYLFASLPLIISTGIILSVQKIINHKYVGIAISAAIILFTATSISKQFIKHPLLRFQIPYNGLFSDINGFGPYMQSYSWLYFFGLSIVIILAICSTYINKFRFRFISLPSVFVFLICSLWSATNFMKGYQSKNEDAAILKQAMYEKEYRNFENKPQPTVVDVKTTIDLFTEENEYFITANYIVQNKTNHQIDSILVNFAENITIKEANFTYKNKEYKVQNQYTVIQLQHSLLPGDTAQFSAQFSYKWFAVNGHQSFNAIVQNGSFMRISRYYPTFGYLIDNEIDSNDDRNKFKLGNATAPILIEHPKTTTNDFINLDMVVSTHGRQTAIGVGELISQWQKNNRNYFHFKTSSPIPFRFAVSSAEYAVKKISFLDKSIEIYYHPSHYQNVDHLLKNAQITMEYCEANFGAYPFKTIRFAEISAFTKGFAATAYPTTIFMAENVIYNANINADKKQDVINELAGHELAHFWWGTSQISPDYREGDVMITETLAMYTELMLAKKMHGNKRVKEIVNMHLGIYLNERGFAEEQPLYKALSYNSHLSYSKGLVAMYQLTEMIGEEKVNSALHNFLQKHSYPNIKPISTDFINELYAVTDTLMHLKIDDLFKRITLYDFKITNTTVKKAGMQYELTLNAEVNKYYEDGKGGKTLATFNDSVDITIQLDNDQEEIFSLPIVNNKIYAKISVSHLPKSLKIEPKTKFIKINETDEWIIEKSL